MIEEWVIRTLLGMLVANIFIAGLYLTLRGHLIRQFLNRFRNKTAATMERMGRFSAIIKWYKNGESIHSIEPNLFTIVRKENIYIYTAPQSYEFTLDMWPYNGKGLIAAGILLLALSLAGFFWLLVGF